ncbi:MAG TPA: recombination protein RecR [Phycisphaerae bacterium]|nr:recombination protein RecR [Phycisphaerae bacterium]
MAGYSESIERLMAELGRLPGIGARTAERLAFHLLKASDEDALALASAISDVKSRIHPCRVCFNLAEDELCSVCSDTSRDGRTICVVEQPKDLLALEATGTFRGVYHVLMGQIAPLENINPEDLTIDALISRVRAGDIDEIILATNPTVAGDMTALHIQGELEQMDVKITRLARGLPAGGQIEYSSRTILSDAINERRKME